MPDEVRRPRRLARTLDTIVFCSGCAILYAVAGAFLVLSKQYDHLKSMLSHDGN
jgi:hypothetical protein